MPKSMQTRATVITGLDYWTGLLDWTTGLDYWTGLLDWTTGLGYWTGLLDWATGLHGLLDSNFIALKTFSTRYRVVYCITLAYKLAVGPPVQRS